MRENERTSVRRPRTGYLLVAVLLLCSVCFAASCGRADDKYGRPTDTFVWPTQTESTETESASERTETETTEAETTERPIATRLRSTEAPAQTEEAIPVVGTEPTETRTEEPPSAETPTEPTETATGRIHRP